MKIEEAVKRLAIIKYLYNVATEQSMKPEPLGSTSVLTFHDTIELFLELAAEHLDKGKSGVDFMGYWELLAPKIEGGLTQKESCRQLNTARVGLKHSGITPSKLAIEGFRATTTNFLEESTLKVFGIKFCDISLIALVKNEKTRNYLHESENLLKEGKIEDSLDKAALAFSVMIDDYESNKRDRFGRSPFFFGEHLHFLSSFFMHIEGDLGKFVDRVKESIEALQEAVKLLSLGLDYRKYSRFRLLTPYVLKTSAGYQIQRIQRGSEGDPVPVDVQFCIDFTIESALALQGFDFSLESHE
jgi:hypothetical protein